MCIISASCAMLPSWCREIELWHKYSSNSMPGLWTIAYLGKSDCKEGWMIPGKMGNSVIQRITQSE